MTCRTQKNDQSLTFSFDLLAQETTASGRSSTSVPRSSAASLFPFDFFGLGRRDFLTPPIGERPAKIWPQKGQIAFSEASVFGGFFETLEVLEGAKGVWDRPTQPDSRIQENRRRPPSPPSFLAYFLSHTKKLSSCETRAFALS